MSHHYIEDKDGDPLRGPHGGRMFWSDDDGDWSPDEHQTVYEDRPDRGMWDNDELGDTHYNPEDGTFHHK